MPPRSSPGSARCKTSSTTHCKADCRKLFPQLGPASHRADFLNARSDRQVEAAAHIRAALAAYDVQATTRSSATFTPPAELMKTQTDRKIAEEEKKTYETQEAAQRQRQNS